MIAESFIYDHVRSNTGLPNLRGKSFFLMKYKLIIVLIEFRIILQVENFKKPAFQKLLETSHDSRKLHL